MLKVDDFVQKFYLSHVRTTASRESMAFRFPSAEGRHIDVEVHVAGEAWLACQVQRRYPLLAKTYPGQCLKVTRGEGTKGYQTATFACLHGSELRRRNVNKEL